MKKYLAAKTKHGIAEAISLEWLATPSGKKWDKSAWMKTLIKQEGAGIEFEELKESEVEKGISKYGEWHAKNKKEQISAIAKIKKDLEKKTIEMTDLQSLKEETKPKKTKK